MKLTDSLEQLDGVGPKINEAFFKAGVNSISDLLDYLPVKYIDYSQTKLIKDIKPGLIIIKAKISNVAIRRSRRGLTITEAIASDQSSSIHIIWFNQPYIKTSIKPDAEYYLIGTYKLSRTHFTLFNPTIELIDKSQNKQYSILPIYKQNKILTSKIVRKTMIQALKLTKSINETLPPLIISQLKLMALATAYKEIHFPESSNSMMAAKERLNFDSLFPLLLSNELMSIDRQKQKTITVPFNSDLAIDFVKRLPFNLTDDQRRVIWQIYLDMQKDTAMNRLVEGDVGSGKTVVAVMAAVMTIASGNKVAFMAPTELLARQHAVTIEKLLKPLNMDDKFFLLTGSQSKKQRQEIISMANKINNSFVIGTHSLLTCGIDWHNLALIIIDEQHRFGVDQRLSLQQQAGILPHFLSITATPIPRSLALTIFNDLKLSRLKTMPENRKPIKSFLIMKTEVNRLYERLTIELEKGRQVYVVCPYINNKDDFKNISLLEVFETFKTKFAKYNVGMIHGQMPSDEQANVMKGFIANEVNILIATTVIEVGVDVANAVAMVIYGPERFGLAQLHQLRGRVGRGEFESYCFLVISENSDPPNRLRQFINIDDGFELSELDLANRGPGAIYGTLQHGKSYWGDMTLDDKEFIKKVKEAVDLFVSNNINLLKYKKLAQQVNEAQKLTNLN